MPGLHAEPSSYTKKLLYHTVQENGQRRYGPPPDWEGDPPQKGCEVFIGKLPRDVYEDELLPYFEKIGPIYMFRLMMDFNGCNRGFAFVTYVYREHAKEAIKKLNNFELRKGRHIGVVKSRDNCRLFVGGIPDTKAKEDIMEEMKKVTEGVVDVILYSKQHDKSKSRGFAFVEYEDHRKAAMARRHILNRKIPLWGNPSICVDWAEPEPDVDEDIMSKVKILYVRNLVLSTTEEDLHDIFSKVGCDTVERVKKQKDYAFVHFSSREAAAKALNQLNNTKIDGSLVEVMWAKPVDKNYKQKKALRQAPTSRLSIYAGAQPTIFIPSSYVNGYYIERSPATLNKTKELIVTTNKLNTAVTQADNHTGQPAYPCETLLDMCTRYNWGEPTYTLLTTKSSTPPLYFYKIRIPGLSNEEFQPSRLSASPEEARVVAAETVLSYLGFSREGTVCGQWQYPYVYIPTYTMHAYDNYEQPLAYHPVLPVTYGYY